MQNNKFTIESTVFPYGGRIPEEYSGYGKDISPPLKWGNLPPGTKELVLICEDPDAPRNPPFVHWVLYNIPAHRTELPKGVSNEDSHFLEFEQGENSASEIGYLGPMPPAGSGEHRYQFRLIALNKGMNLPPGLSKEEVLEAIEEHIISEVETMGTYRHH